MNAMPAQLPAMLMPYWNADPATPTFFAGGRPESDGILYRFQKDGHAAILKILELNAEDPHALRVSEERALLMAHFSSHGVSMPRLLPAAHDAASIVIQAEGRTFRAYAMEEVSGKAPHQLTETERPALVGGMGAVIGQMHAATVLYPVWEGLPRTDGAPRLLHWQSEMDFFAGWLRDDAARACWERLRLRLAALPQTRATMGFIHNDPHPWNFLWHEGALTVLDFDVANCHFLLNDIAIAYFSLLMELTDRFTRPLDRHAAQGTLAVLLHGYNRSHTLPAGWEEQLDLFLQYRRLLLLCAMSDGLGVVPPHLAAMHRLALAEEPVI
mgnify:CR=1 FL=1